MADNTMGQVKLANPITDESEKLIIRHVQDLISCRTNLGIFRTKLAQCDSYVSREPNKNNPSKKQPLITVPIVSPQVDTMVAYFAKLFLSSDSVFPVTTSPNYDSMKDAINTIFQGFSRDWQWRRNLILCFKDAAKYNMMFAETTWSKVKVGTLASPAVQLAGSTSKKATQTIKSGFDIKHLDPYNTFFDISVQPSQLSSDGEFAGYFEVMNKIQLHRYLLSLEDNSNYQSRIPSIMSSQSSSRNFFVPSILTYTARNNSTLDWDQHFQNVLNLGGGTQEAKEVCTVYLRIIPNDFNMRKVPQGGTPQIWKFVIVNYQYIVYAECRSNAHDYLPIVIGQPYESNLGFQQKAAPEELASLQDMASHLWSMEIASNQRAVSNREFYNPLLVASDDINNPNPSAKIPIRNAAIGQDINKVVMPVPFNDPAAGTRTQLATGITNFAGLLMGTNQVSGGQFIKGNKTDGQFQEVLNRADARQTTMAILLEDQFFAVVRHILLFDFMQYQEDTQVYSQLTQSMQTFTATDVMQAPIEFVINDALSLSSDSIDPQILQVGMQAIGSNQQLSSEYDIGKLFNHFMSLNGVKDLDQFLSQQGAQSPQVDANGNPIPQQQGQQPPVVQGQPVVPQQQVPLQGIQPNQTPSPIDEQAYQQQIQQGLATNGGTPNASQ